MARKNVVISGMLLVLTSYSFSVYAEVTIDDLRGENPNFTGKDYKQSQKSKSGFYSSVTDLMSAYNDYPVEIGAFRIKSERPLEVQISPRIMAGELKQPEYIVDNVEKAAIYAAYRILFQTKTDSVKITSLPLLIDAQSSRKEYVKEYAITFMVTKQSAKKISNRYCEVSTIVDLIGSGDHGFSDDFQNNCYLSSARNHKSFFADLTHSQSLSY